MFYYCILVHVVTFCFFSLPKTCRKYIIFIYYTNFTLTFFYLNCRIFLFLELLLWKNSKLSFYFLFCLSFCLFGCLIVIISLYLSFCLLYVSLFPYFFNSVAFIIQGSSSTRLTGLGYVTSVRSPLALYKRCGCL